MVSLSNEDYKAVIETLSEITNYKDSKKIIDVCKKKISGSWSMKV